MLLSYFAMEVCLPMENSACHESLRTLLVGAQDTVSPMDKWSFYQDVYRHLLSNVSSLTRGCWDYFDDDVRARHDYDEYAETLETHRGVRREPPKPGDAYRSMEQQFFTVTTAFLIVRDTDCDRRLRDLTSFGPSQLWMRSTFQRILGGMGVLNFASIKSDCAYMIPRETGWGLTEEDLSNPTFGYLRMIQD